MLMPVSRVFLLLFPQVVELEEVAQTDSGSCRIEIDDATGLILKQILNKVFSMQWHKDFHMKADVEKSVLLKPQILGWRLSYENH